VLTGLLLLWPDPWLRPRRIPTGQEESDGTYATDGGDAYRGNAAK
jgi:hypothetical protein